MRRDPRPLTERLAAADQDEVAPVSGEEVTAPQHLFPAVTTRPSLPSRLIENVVAARLIRRTASRRLRVVTTEFMKASGNDFSPVPAAR